MKQIEDYDNLKLWLSAGDTYDWAHRPGSAWPCSQLSGKRLFAEFDHADLIDVRVNGRCMDCDATEFTAITTDHAPEYFARHGR